MIFLRITNFVEGWAKPHHHSLEYQVRRLMFIDERKRILLGGEVQIRLRYHL